MKNVVVIPIFNDEYKVICTWGDEKQWRRVARSYHHRIVPGDDVLNGRHGVTLVTPGYHPLIILHKFPKLPDEVATLAHEAVHAIEAIFEYKKLPIGGEIFADSVGAIVRIVLQNSPKKVKK